jgi:Homeodomain-like domain
LNAKRDRLIVAVATEGKTQQQIAKALDIPQQTVADVLKRNTQNGGTAKTGTLPEIPDLFAAQPDGDFDWPLSGTVDDR